jgi:hypothetical protein
LSSLIISDVLFGLLTWGVSARERGWAAGRGSTARRERARARGLGGRARGCRAGTRRSGAAASRPGRTGGGRGRLRRRSRAAITSTK